MSPVAPPDSAPEDPPSLGDGAGGSIDLVALQLVATLIESLEQGQRTWVWIGGAAQRIDVVESVRALAPAGELTEAFATGVACAARKGRCRRPSADEAVIKRVERAMAALHRRPPFDLSQETEASSATADTFTITSMIRRSPGPGRGSRFTLEIATPQGSITLRNLTGKELSKISEMSGRVLDEGATFPYFGKGAQSRWKIALDHALGDPNVYLETEMAPGEDRGDAVIAAIRSVLRGRPQSDDRADLPRGQVWDDVGTLVIDVNVLVREVKRLLPEDRLDRGFIADCARLLGMRPASERLDGVSGLLLWRFPGSAQYDPDSGEGTSDA